MKDKVVSAAEAVALIEDGMTIGVGGWGARRKPMQLLRELCRTPVRDLTIVSYGGPDVGMLCAAGKVRKLVFGFVSLDAIPLDPYFREAREKGRIEVMELDEGMLQWGLYAAALRLPFLPTRAGLASDAQRLNRDLRQVDSPYEDRETLLAMPALPLDVALVHVNRADRHGNGVLSGPDPYFDDLYCSAATTAVISTERLVETKDLLGDDCLGALALNRSQVTHVVESPGGAAPTSCQPDYEVDEAGLGEYATNREGVLS